MRRERIDYEWAAIKSMLCQIQDGKGKSVSEYLMNWDRSAPKAPQGGGPPPPPRGGGGGGPRRRGGATSPTRRFSLVAPPP